jgi:hypothetical protein
LALVFGIRLLDNSGMVTDAGDISLVKVSGTGDMAADYRPSVWVVALGSAAADHHHAPRSGHAAPSGRLDRLRVFALRGFDPRLQ